MLSSRLGRKPIFKTTLATANQKSSYRIFKAFAFYMMSQARENHTENIFKLRGKVYAFDSTMIPLCLRSSGGLISARKKVLARFMSFTTCRRKCQPSTTSLQILSKTPRSCSNSIIKQMPTTSSTEVTTTSGCFTAYSGWSHYSLSEPRQTYYTDASSGNSGCRRIYSPLQRLS